MMANLNFILEQINGSVSLLTFFFLCWCSWYLWEFFSYRGTYSLRTALVGLPPAIGLAVILYVEKTGSLMTRGAVWVWRTTTGGMEIFSKFEMLFLFSGAILSAFGMLLLIRILSRPRFGEWPWIASGIIAYGYVLVSVLIRIL